MSAIHTNPGPSASPHTGALAQSGRANFGQAAANGMSMKWSALHDASGVVAMLAGMPAAPMKAEARNFPALIRDCGGWRRELAEQGVDDLSVILEAGLAALLAVHARGVDTCAAAMALWHEFDSARQALLDLIPQTDGAALRRTY